MRSLLLAGASVAAFSLAANAALLTEGFDSGVAPPAGWTATNNSTTIGTTGWFDGNDLVFPEHAGTGYIGANYNNTTGANTISNWLITPSLAINGAEHKLTFFTRTVDSTTTFPDRLQVRLSPTDSTNVGVGAAAVGNFTTLLLDINPTLTTSGYPKAWTQYDVTIPAGSIAASGRLAFRYFVPSGGPSGANSDYIGIDTLSLAPVPEPASMGAVALAGFGMLARRKRQA